MRRREHNADLDVSIVNTNQLFDYFYIVFVYTFESRPEVTLIVAPKSREITKTQECVVFFFFYNQCVFRALGPDRGGDVRWFRDVFESRTCRFVAKTRWKRVMRPCRFAVGATFVFIPGGKEL